MLSSFWHQIRGNAKWDLLKAILRATGVAGMISAAWFYFQHWLGQAANNQTIVGILAISTIALTAVWIMNCRLLILPSRLEFVSQRPDGTAYQRSGRTVAISLPVKNEYTWWHSGLAESQTVSAHIDFFSEDGEMIESVYGPMWIGEQGAFVSLRNNETKTLIVALAEERKGMPDRS